MRTGPSHDATRQIDATRLTTGGVAVKFFLCSVIVFGAAAGVAVFLRWLQPPVPRPTIVFPPAFAVTTFLLLGAGASLHRAVAAVRRERQAKFRRNLLAAAFFGLMFVGVQIYGLECLIRGESGDPQTGARPFVFVFAAMHGLHVSVALLFLTFVTVRAWAGRYDHEYYWGPLFAGWFWHALGVAWIVILGVLGISL